jgi:hypothetical protein
MAVLDFTKLIHYPDPDLFYAHRISLHHLLLGTPFASIITDLAFPTDCIYIVVLRPSFSIITSFKVTANYSLAVVLVTSSFFATTTDHR